jgi:hypothetical protein
MRQSQFCTPVDTLRCRREGASTPSVLSGNQHSAFSALTTGAVSADQFVVGDPALDADDHLIYDAQTGDLIYDDNGSGAGGETDFAVFTKQLDLSHLDSPLLEAVGASVSDVNTTVICTYVILNNPRLGRAIVKRFRYR